MSRNYAARLRRLGDRVTRFTCCVAAKFRGNWAPRLKTAVSSARRECPLCLRWPSNRCIEVINTTGRYCWGFARPAARLTSNFKTASKEPRTRKTTRRAGKSFANGWPFRRISDKPKNRWRHSPKRRPSKTSSTVVGAIRTRNLGAILSTRSWDGCCRAPASHDRASVGNAAAER